MAEEDRPLPKFGEWDVNDPASAEGFTVIFNKARNEKKTGGKPDSPAKDGSTYKPGATATLGKPQTQFKIINRDVNLLSTKLYPNFLKKWFCCIQATHAD